MFFFHKKYNNLSPSMKNSMKQFLDNSIQRYIADLEKIKVQKIISDHLNSNSDRLSIKAAPIFILIFSFGIHVLVKFL
jgi:hypothetical protein